MTLRLQRWAATVSLSAVTATGDVEAVEGLLQLFGAHASRHDLYSVTGTFFNPGPYGALLGVAFAAAVALALEKQSGEKAEGKPAVQNKFSPFLRIFGYLSIFIITMPLAASMSRTGWIAAAIGCVVVMVRKCPGHPRIRWRRRLAGILLAFLTATAAVGLYAMKAPSANGRLLIWKCGCIAAARAPLSGTGEKFVMGAYGDAQEEYFRTGERSDAEKTVAGSPEYFFNEYLHIATAFGFPAAAAFTALLVFAFTNALKAGCRGCAATVAALAAACFASYPFEFPLFLWTGAAIVGGALAAPGFSGVFMTTARWMLIAATVTTAAMACRGLDPGKRGEVEQLFRYARSLQRSGRHELSQRRFAEAMRRSADPMIPALMSKNADALGDTASARIFLEKAILRCPARMYPRYLLMLHYKTAEDSVRMRLAAEQLLEMPVKIKSPATSDMRKEAARILENEH